MCISFVHVTPALCTSVTILSFYPFMLSLNRGKFKFSLLPFIPCPSFKQGGHYLDQGSVQCTQQSCLGLQFYFTLNHGP
ncbi:hypothetical protein EMCRGX_G010307 [Ephydatia muelleri]